MSKKGSISFFCLERCSLAPLFVVTVTIMCCPSYSMGAAFQRAEGVRSGSYWPNSAVTLLAGTQVKQHCASGDIAAGTSSIDARDTGKTCAPNRDLSTPKKDSGDGARQQRGGPIPLGATPTQPFASPVEGQKDLIDVIRPTTR